MKTRIINIKDLIYACIFIFALTGITKAQIDTSFYAGNIKFADFLKQVCMKNLDYAVQRYNVPIAEAEIEISKLFPDPNLSFDWSENYLDNLRDGYGFQAELGFTLELGGKRGARIDLAENKKILAQLMLDDYLRNLVANSAVTYIRTLKQKQIFKIKLDSYNAMIRLSDAVSVRHKLGTNSEIDETQSKLEAGIMFNDLLQSNAEWKNSSYDIAFMVSQAKTDSLFIPSENLIKITRVFNLGQLIENALAGRKDVIAASHSIKIAESAIQLAESERSIDLDLKFGYGRDYSVPPADNIPMSYSAGISIPLKFSNFFYNGTVQSAKLQKNQAADNYKNAKLLVEIEIKQAYQLYITSLKQVESFEGGLLEKGKKVLEGKIYSYKRGETSLLDVLMAQRTFNDIQSDYYDTLTRNIEALINLERAAGIWDIEL